MISQDQITKLRTQAGLTPTLPAISPQTSAFPDANTYDDVIAKRKLSLGITDTAPRDTSLDIYGGGEEGIANKLKKDIQAGAEDYGKNDFSMKQLLGPTKAAARVAGDTAGLVFHPIGVLLDKLTGGKMTEAFTDIKSKLEKGESPVGKNVVSKLADIPAFQQFAMEHPNAEEDFQRLLNLVLASGENSKIEPKTVVDRTIAQVKSIPEIPGKIIDKASEFAPKEKVPTFEDRIAETQKVLNPTGKYSPTEVEKLRSKGEIKVEGMGPFKKEVANPKPTKTNETLADLVERGKVSAKNLPSENTAAIKQEARALDLDIEDVVNRPALNKPYTQNTLNKVFDKVENSAKEDLVFISDTAEAKAYKAVMDVAKEEIAKNPYNMAGLRKSIKNFNARMERILDKDIYGDGENAVGNARLQAAKDMRTALNDFLADNLEIPPTGGRAPANTKMGEKNVSGQFIEKGKVEAGGLYKDLLQKEAQLLNSADEIGYRSRGTLGKTELKKYLENNPKLKNTLKFIGTAGLGAGLWSILGINQ